jgi:hypothetical protein
MYRLKDRENYNPEVVGKKVRERLPKLISYIRSCDENHKNKDEAMNIAKQWAADMNDKIGRDCIIVKYPDYGRGTIIFRYKLKNGTVGNDTKFFFEISSKDLTSRQSLITAEGNLKKAIYADNRKGKRLEKNSN